VSKEALPKAAALLEAAKEGRLMDVVLPNGQSSATIDYQGNISCSTTSRRSATSPARRSLK
jgi:hypothetical protein